MRWRGRRGSTNVEDRRGRRGGGGLGGGGGLKIGGGATIILLLIALFLGGDPMSLLSMITGGGSPSPAPRPPTGSAPPANDEASQMVSVVLADTEEVWGELFRQGGARYRPPTLVLFDGMVRSACGVNSAQTGPFYCPGDQKVYIDLSFFNQLKRLGAPGDFAQAYVLGHEVGHHVQNLLGTDRQVRQAQGRSRSQAQVNQLSVALELQADCYAGVWANHAERRFDLLEAGDVEEGLRAAAAIGDDRLQQMSGRAANPESFTHGSSEQRVSWFRRGLSSGDMQACDTFG